MRSSRDRIAARVLRLVVAVPANTPVGLIEPADRSALAPGASVAVYAVRRPDGRLAAERVNVGRNGYVPAR